MHITTNEIPLLVNFSLVILVYIILYIYIIYFTKFLNRGFSCDEDTENLV